MEPHELLKGYPSIDNQTLEKVTVTTQEIIDIVHTFEILISSNFSIEKEILQAKNKFLNKKWYL